MTQQVAIIAGLRGPVGFEHRMVQLKQMFVEQQQQTLVQQQEAFAQQ